MSKPRVIAITGGLGVLGAATARAAIEQGLCVAVIDFLAPPEAASPAQLTLGNVDLRDEQDCQRAFASIAAQLGGIDALLNIAGGFLWAPLEDGKAEHWVDMFKLNVVTARNATLAALPFLKRSPAGRIVNVGSTAALKSAAGMGAYAAAKSGVHRLTESLAEELKPDGVAVNAVLPSIIDTPANRSDMPDADFSAWVPPTDLARVMLFLASPEAASVTGALLPVVGRT